MTPDELADVRASHERNAGDPTADYPWFCVRDGNDWPCEVVRLLDHIDAMAEAFERLTPEQRAEWMAYQREHPASNFTEWPDSRRTG